MKDHDSIFLSDILGEVTWCEDRQDPSDVEYVNAKVLAEKLKEIDELKHLVNRLCHRKPTFTISDLRNYYDQYQKGDISFGRFKELITEHYDQYADKLSRIDKEMSVNRITNRIVVHKLRTPSWSEFTLAEAIRQELERIMEG